MVFTPDEILTSDDGDRAAAEAVTDLLLIPAGNHVLLQSDAPVQQ